jgi:hypothetical protein
LKGRSKIRKLGAVSAHCGFGQIEDIANGSSPGNKPTTPAVKTETQRTATAKAGIKVIHR